MANNDQSLQLLRVILNAKVPLSAMIVVSSACADDEQAELACGLAHAFSEAGRNTALISLYDHGDARYYCITDADSRVFTGSFFQAPASPVELDSLVASVRAGHEIVIVASPPIIADSSALHLCRIADGVLLAVRLGRKVIADDENTVTQLQRVGANLLGVIAMEPPARQVTKSSDDIIVGDEALETTPLQRVSSLISAALSPVLTIGRLRHSARPPATERLPLL